MSYQLNPVTVDIFIPTLGAPLGYSFGLSDRDQIAAKYISHIRRRLRSKGEVLGTRKGFQSLPGFGNLSLIFLVFKFRGSYFVTSLLSHWLNLGTPAKIRLNRVRVKDKRVIVEEKTTENTSFIFPRCHLWTPDAFRIFTTLRWETITMDKVIL